MKNEKFAQLLNIHLNHAERSGSWLARQLGVSPSTVTRWLNGETRPEMSSIVLKIITLLEVRSKTDQQALLGSLDFELSEYLTEDPTSPKQGTFTDEISLARPPIHSNLPVPLTKLIGRQQELISLRKLLSGEYRLVTLTGPGGVGKTRLAQQIASELTSDFANGVYFVSLASVTESDWVLSEIAQALGVKELGNKTLLANIKEYLQEKQILLILDNFEHLLLAAPLIADLLLYAPQLKVLSTSREELYIRGEYEFPISPLELPDSTHALSAKSLMRYSAIETFVYYAQAVNPDFTLNESNAVQVSEICAQLDGLPLAIELMAVHIKTHSVHEISRLLKARVGARFEILNKGPRDLPMRQQTLRAAIDWSYDLLNEEEKTLFRRLSVFVNGFDIDGISAISSLKVPGVRAPEESLLRRLRALQEKSLVFKISGTAKSERYSMLETIRAYAAAKLSETPEEQITKRRLVAFCFHLAQQAEPSMFSVEETKWLQRLHTEYHSFQSAMECCLQSTDLIEAALEIGFVLWRYWEAYGLISDGRAWLDRLLIASTHFPSTIRSNALYAAGDLALTQSDYETGRQYIQESLAISIELGMQTEKARSLNGLGRVAYYLGEYESAHQYFHEAIAISRTIGDVNVEAKALNNLAVIASVQGDYLEALKYYNQCLPLFRKKGDSGHIAYLVCNMAGITFYQGDYELARLLYQESYDLQKNLGDKWGISQAAFGLARLAVTNRDFALATAFLVESSQLQLQLQDKHEIADRLQGFAELALLEDKCERATVLLSAADNLRKTIGAPIIPVLQSKYEEILTSLHITLTERDFQKAWLTGQMLDWQRSLLYALNAYEKDLTKSNLPFKAT